MGPAGAVLIVLGALWMAIGAVLLVLAWLYRDVTALPDWVNVEVAPSSSAWLVLGALGLAAVAAGAGQLASGFVLQRHGDGWPAVLGMILAMVGAGVVAAWLVTGLVHARPVLILLPALVAYLYVASSIAIRGGWLRAG
jgi:hypothetical protein